MLSRVCKNAMKQYRRTRPESSRDGVRRAKALLEGERLETGQRVGKGAIAPHPLLRGAELRQFHAMTSNKDNPEGSIGTLENLRKREEFLRAMSNFRPKETIFEAFATGKVKDVGVGSQIDKGRTTMNKKNDSTAALLVMKNMRRQMRMARDKGSTLVIAGSANARETNGDLSEEDEDNLQQEEIDEEGGGGSARKLIGSQQVKGPSTSIPDVQGGKASLEK
jgi:hypothetical protein